MTTEIVPSTDFFKVSEANDEKQIMNIEEFKDILCYKDSKTGKHELSYRGIKHLVLEMAAKGFPLEVVSHEVELVGDGKEKTWYASVKVRNQNTKLESEGHSEAPFYENDSKNPPTFKEPLTKDPFARTKALSKAERNANKKQLPEAMIVHLVNDATTKGKTITISNDIDYCVCIKPQPGLSTGKCVTCGKVVKK